MTNPVAGWLHLMRTYNDDTLVTITNLEIMELTTLDGNNSYDYLFRLPRVLRSKYIV